MPAPFFKNNSTRTSHKTELRAAVLVNPSWHYTERMKNMQSTRRLWRILTLSLGGLLLFASCKGQETTPAEETISAPEASPALDALPDPYTVEPNSADAVLEAYLLCLQDGEREKAEQYVWPMADSESAKATEAFWQPFEAAGYLGLESYSLQKTGENELYSTYNVDLKFTLPPGAERSDEAVAAGDTLFMPPAPEEIRMNQEAEAEAAAAAREEEDQPLDEWETEGEGLPSNEEGVDGNTEELDENGAEASGSTPEEDGEALTPGYETVLLTVVHADDRYYVSPQNLLAVYQSTDIRSRLELETEWAQEIEDGLSEVENREPTHVDSPEISGVYAQLVSARRYSDSLSLDIRFENYGTEPYAMGEEDFLPVLEMEGVFLGLDPFASPQLAQDFGFSPLSPEAGAKAGHFTTFAPAVTLEPGAPETSTTMENVRFVGNYEIVYTLFFPDFDSETLAVSLENMEAIPGYLPVRNPFADFEGLTPEEEAAAASEESAEEGAAIGIIGGPDGPTQIITSGD